MLSWDEETVLSLCVRVLKTLSFAMMWWLLSQCKYWSAWVGFLYTVVLKVFSGCMVTIVSKKGSDSCCVGSTVNIVNTPSPYLQQFLHQHHLGKFLIFLFVSLTFLSDLMKQLQYGCQQKLVSDFVMILLCFQHFQFYSICIQTKIVTL